MFSQLLNLVHMATKKHVFGHFRMVYPLVFRQQSPIFRAKGASPYRPQPRRRRSAGAEIHKTMGITHLPACFVAMPAVYLIGDASLPTRWPTPATGLESVGGGDGGLRRRSNINTNPSDFRLETIDP